VILPDTKELQPSTMHDGIVEGFTAAHVYIWKYEHFSMTEGEMSDFSQILKSAAHF
jgi:hypothetical protein